MTPLNIEGRILGPGQPTFVIAELGVNHDGSAQKAIELVRIASNCGANAVKLQFFRAATLLHGSSTLAAYQKDRGRDTSPVDLLRRYELSADDIRRVVKAIRDLRMVPLATPFSPADLEMVETMRLPAVKIASPDLVNRPLLRRAAETGKPLLVSTGAADMAEVDTTVDWLRAWRSSFALLHCVSAYPVPAASANLSWVTELANRFDVPVGYSDHTADPLSGALAVAAGARVIERHLTYDRGARGPDHASSSDPVHFERYVKLVREADLLCGGPGKRVLDIEQDVRIVSRQSLVARRTLRVGDVLTEDALTVQRPGTGISASRVADLVGRTAIKPVPAGTMLQWDMFSDAPHTLPEVA